MKTNQAFFFAIIPFAVIGLIIPVHAEIEQGKNYDKEFMGYDAGGNEIYQLRTHPERIWDGAWKDYRLTQNSTTIILETANSGSLAFSKSGCSYSFYGNGIIDPSDTPTVQDISYTVKGKPNASSTWSNVNTINNAACAPSIMEYPNGTAKILGTKTNGAGTFQIELKYTPGEGIKETLKAYNNNPAWNNHNIGFTEKFQVPQVIKFGKNTYDLSQYNNTVLDRNWIINNKAKLIELSDGMFYDFGIGFANLQDLKITWINYKAYLSLNYLYGGYIVPYQQWIEVDPTLVVQDTSYLVNTANGAGAACPGGPYAKSAATGQARKSQSTDAGDGCYRAIASWDITALPVTAFVTNSSAMFTSSGTVNMGTESCESYRVMNDPATAAAALLWNDAEHGTRYYTANTGCQSNNTYDIDLGATADSEIQASRAAGNTTFSISVKLTSEVRDAGAGHAVSFVNNAIDLTITYISAKPDAVTTLHSTDITTTTVDLAWTPPNMNGGTCSGYQINYTSPWGQPITILLNNTGVCTAAYDVSGLTLNTPYSFRVSARTQLGVNASGNILNVTTLAFNQANFTIGSFNFQANNPIIFPIRYERQDLNSSHTFVNVTYDNTFNLACDLRYTYAGTNHTYTGMSSVPVSASEDEVSFRFVNTTNEITTFHCWNQAGNQSANYVLTQTDFLLLQQLEDFRNGTYGTMGQFGAFDLISLIVIIVSMIGLNFKSESVAGFFCIVAITVLTFFEMIQWYTAIIAAVAVVTMLAIASTRKD